MTPTPYRPEGYITVRGIAEEISALAGHNVIDVAQSDGRDHCAHCTLWVDTSRLLSALLGKIEEGRVTVEQAQRTLRVTKRYPGRPGSLS